MQHAVRIICQGGIPRSCLLTVGEGSCLLCGFEAKGLESEEPQKATEDGSDQIFWKSFSSWRWEQPTTRLFSVRYASTDWGYFRKNEEDFWGSAKPHKNTLRARERPARISRVVLGVSVSRRKKTQKLVGTQIKDQLDACCSIKDFFLSSHSNYRILMVNKLAGGQKVSGERLLEPTNLSGGASLDFFKLEGDSWHRISFPYDCCCVKWDWYTRNTEVEKAPEAFLLPCEKREAYRICWDIITITWFPQFVAASLSRSLFKDDWHAGLHSSSFIARQTPGRS